MLTPVISGPPAEERAIAINIIEETRPSERLIDWGIRTAVSKALRDARIRTDSDNYDAVRAHVLERARQDSEAIWIKARWCMAGDLAGSLTIEELESLYQFVQTDTGRSIWRKTRGLKSDVLRRCFLKESDIEVLPEDMEPAKAEVKD